MWTPPAPMTSMTLPMQNTTDEIGIWGTDLSSVARFPVLETSSSGEFGHFARTVLGATAVDQEASDNFSGHLRFFQLQHIAILSGSANSRVTLEYPATNQVQLHIALKGRALATVGGLTTEIHENQSCTLGPGRASQVIWEEDFQGLTLRIGTRALTRELALLLGAEPKGSLEFAAATNVQRPSVQALHQMILFCTQQLGSTLVELPALALLRLEQAIVASFLCASRHTFSHLLKPDARDVTPRLIRQVEEFIEANWNKAITVENLAELTGAKARTVFKAFQRNRGYSPKAFVKVVRLNHAKEMLSSPNAHTSVTGVGFACGFGNLGHFAKDYREAFGERPSETLARQRMSVVGRPPTHLGVRFPN
jgi:AraC-like DNA-binding protein